MTFNSCGQCPSCYEHEESYCYDFFGRNFAGARPDGSSPISKPDEHIHGNFFGQSSFATDALCHERNIVKVTTEVPLELLGPLACGLQTGAGSVINGLKVRPGQSIAVFGTGSVGFVVIATHSAKRSDGHWRDRYPASSARYAHNRVASR